MLPDWLREEGQPPAKQYAGHDYPMGDERGGRGGDRRSGGFGARGNDRRGAGGPPDRRRDGGGRSGPPPRGGGSRGPRDDRRDAPAPQPYVPPALAPVRVEFLPDDKCLASINKQIRSTHLAYPLFGLARMFLQEPERHYVQFSVAPDAPAGTLLYQLGEDGPVTLDRTTLEKMAFDSTKDQFYVEQSVQKEPLKGNFTNVARERLSGTLLGPTNYHAYQPALRSLYESRYSRRMSFEDFRRNVEVSTDPALIERWKEEARTTTTISTVVPEGETPVVLNSPADARAHFRQHHLENLVRSGTTLKVHGSVARKLPEPAMMQAIRESHDREMRYPAQFVQLLRQGLQNSGLHIFKHRKRVVYVSLSRPTPFVAHGTVSPNVAAILETIAQFPLCTRKLLAEKVIARNGQSNPSPAQAKATPDGPEQAAPVAGSTTTLPETRASVGADQPANVEEPAASAPADASEQPEPEAVASHAPEAPVPIEAPAAPLTETPAPQPPVSAPSTDDPAARARAGLAADLRFLVQAGHIIEFHNGTFDLPLPPRPKEEPKAPANSGKSSSGNRQPQPARSGLAPAPSTSAPAPQVEPGAASPEFTASGAGVAESLEEADGSMEDEAPSLLEVREPAPTATSLGEDATASTSEPGPDEVVIEPGPTHDAAGVPISHDKTDGDGMISGPAAAPLDLPVFGDKEDSPAAQP